MFIQRSMRNLNAAKRSSYHVFFHFMPYLCVSVVAPAWLIITKHEMACYISYVNRQLFKDAAVYIQQYFL